MGREKIQGSISERASRRHSYYFIKTARKDKNNDGNELSTLEMHSAASFKQKYGLQFCHQTPAKLFKGGRAGARERTTQKIRIMKGAENEHSDSEGVIQGK